jgi:hypothetical protein
MNFDIPTAPLPVQPKAADVCLLITPSSFVAAATVFENGPPTLARVLSINPICKPSGESFNLRRLHTPLPSMAIAAFDIPRVRSNPTHEKQYDEDDQDDADDSRSRSRQSGH